VRPGSALERWWDVWRRASGRGTYPHELAFLLTNPLRGLLLSPRQLVRRLGPAPDARVLELGPGPGYFSPTVARALPRGRLVLVDVQPEMLAKARRRLARARASNVDFVQADGGALPFREARFDAAFLVAVLGETSDPFGCLCALHSCVRPGGVVSVTELPGDPDAIRRPELESLARRAGFEVSATWPTPGGFTCNLHRP
jgi:ubiquinone/menaquinone biosynthesis C-methylase UbiE